MLKSRGWRPLGGMERTCKIFASPCSSVFTGPARQYISYGRHSKKLKQAITLLALTFTRVWTDILLQCRIAIFFGFDYCAPQGTELHTAPLVWYIPGVNYARHEYMRCEWFPSKMAILFYCSVVSSLTPARTSDTWIILWKLLIYNCALRDGRQIL